MENKSIWVVDDDPIFRMIFKMTLKKVTDDFKVLDFENGEDACKAFHFNYKNKTELPHCLFMDINMPSMNGWECLDKMQEMMKGKGKSMPKIFILSSSINPEDRNKVFEYAFTTDYLSKPISIEKFQEILIDK